MPLRRFSRRALRLIARSARWLGEKSDAAAELVLQAPASVPSRPENARFKNIHKGCPAFVIGNGPSLASQDLSPLKGELLFTMNAFDRHPLCRDLQPLHHFLADPLANENSTASEEHLEKIAKLMDSSQIFTLAWPTLKSEVLSVWNGTGRLVQVPVRGALAEGPVSELDMCSGFPGVQTTAQLALMTAAYMGCDPIYLLGVDSDWAAHPSLDRHFYTEPTLDESWDRASYDAYWTYERILEATLLMWRGYRNLWDYLRADGIRVFNCTAGGLLDVFPRMRYEDALASLGSVRGQQDCD